MDNRDIVIGSSCVSFDSLAKDHKELSGEIFNSDVVILPSRKELGAFFAGTLDILDFFKESGGAMSVDILSSDEDYRELSLHSDEFRLGAFLVSSIALPFFVGLIVNYVSDKLKAKKGDKISLEVVIDSPFEESISVKYDGPAENFEDAMGAVKNLKNEKTN